MTRECVDREQLKNMIRGLTKWYVKRDNAGVGQPNSAVGLLYDDVMFGIDRLPSATPQEPILENINKMKYEIAGSLEFWDYSPNNNPLARDILETVTHYWGDIKAESEDKA